MKKHEGFEKSTVAQEDRIEELRQFAQDLCEDRHYAYEEINSRCQVCVTLSFQLVFINFFFTFLTPALPFDHSFIFPVQSTIGPK